MMATNERKAPPMMKCGHAANAVNGATGGPTCAICIGIDPGAEVVDDAPPDLTGRTARCGHYGQTPTGRLHESNYGCKRGQQCLCERPSSPALPFFAHQPGRPHDQFYCGCWGWS